MIAMRRAYPIPILSYRLIRRFTAAVTVLCLAACGSDGPGALPDEDGNEGGSDGKGGEVTVVIAAPQTETRAVPSGDEIRSVRIYAYAHGETDQPPVGYLEDNDFITGVGTYKINLSRRGQLDFIALLNDGGVAQAAASAVALDGNTTLAELNAYRIGRQLNSYNDGGCAIPMSTLEGENGANRTFTLTESTASQYVRLTATRAMSRLRLYFAKHNTGRATVQITGATLTQGPLSTRLLVDEDSESLSYPDDYVAAGTDEETSAIAVAPANTEASYPVEVTDVSAPDTKLTAGNTTLVATAYMPENPYGASNVHPDGLYEDEYDGTVGNRRLSAYKLTVTYNVGDSEGEKDVYLPAVDRNQTVNVFGLLSGEDITLYVRVADWIVEEVILPQHPTYSDCQPATAGNYSTAAGYKVNDGDKLGAAFQCTFEMSTEQVFTPTVNGPFTVVVQNSAHAIVTGNQIKGGTDADGNPLSYFIYVIPTHDYTPSAVNEGYLLITIPDWTGENEPLLINREHKWNANDNPQDDRIRITIENLNPDSGENTNT